MELFAGYVPVHGEKWKPRGQWFGFSRRELLLWVICCLMLIMLQGMRYYYEAARKVANTLIWGSFLNVWRMELCVRFRRERTR